MTAIGGLESGAVAAVTERAQTTTVHRRYLASVVAVDALAAAAPALALSAAGPVHTVQVAAALALAWTGTLAVRGTYRMRLLGRSPLPLLVLRSWATYAGLLGVLVLLTGHGVSVPNFLTALAVPLAVSPAYRWLVHGRMIARHREAVSLARVLLVGGAADVDEAVGYLTRRTTHELAVVGACVVGAADVTGGTPVVSRVPSATADPGPATSAPVAAEVLAAARAVGADAVMILPGAGVANGRLRHLVWALHEADLDVLHAPGLVEVEGHRLEARSVDGLTVLEVRRPGHSGWPLAVKGAFDRVLGAALLLALLPVFLVVALAVRLGSAGPVFYRHTRLGRASAPFTMWKFRSMVTGADLQKAQLELQNQNDGRMFKIQRDPRVTRVGRLLRRCSLDELPQLINVVLGDMSLVGPRPPLPDEVAGYDDVEARRLRVKPGMTGLWQVSGRSDLSWDETVALDLRYVDNWTPLGDLRLLVRTAHAVVSGRGAY